MVGNNGEALHNVYDLPIEQDRFYFLSTYAGPNIRPTPSFVGDPISVDMPSKTLEDMVTSVFDAWSPYDGGEDLRVSVVGLSFSEITQGVECCIKNRF